MNAPTVTRYVITQQRPGQLRALALPAQGRNTFATREEAERALDAYIGSDFNRPEDIARYFSNAEVRPCECWAGHFDPVGIYFD